MFARHVTMRLKPDLETKFTSIVDEQILPLLRKQDGFRDEIAFVTPERSLAVGISFWDSKENADAYDRTSFPDVLKTLSQVLDGTPTVENFEVVSSTFHKTAAKAA